MIGSSQKNRENYLKKYFGTKKKKHGLKLNPGLALIRLQKTLALDFQLVIKSQT